MPRVLYLTLHRPDRSPSQRFRFEQYIDYLAENGFEPTFSYLLSDGDDKVFYKNGAIIEKVGILLRSSYRRLCEVLYAGRYDIIYIQRECFMLGTSFFEKRFSKSRSKLIFDFDDSIWIQNVSDANRKFSFLKNPSKTAEIIGFSDLIFAGNKYLQEYALQFNPKVVVVPTTIDTVEYSPTYRNKELDEPVCIGWSGSMTTIQHFNLAVPFLLKLKERYGDKVVFNVIGDGSFRNDALGIIGIPWIKQDEVAELSKFDIGIMPLPDDKWAKGKCGLKGLQYMALEVPTCMSPVGVNTEIIKDGINGFLPAEEHEWLEKISLLIESRELRERIGKAGRKTVVNSYSVESQKSVYLKQFRTLCS